MHLLVTEFDCPEVNMCDWQDCKILFISNLLIHLLVTEFDCPEVNMCDWQDCKILFISNLLIHLLARLSAFAWLSSFLGMGVIT